MSGIDERKLRGYVFLIEMLRITIDQVPADYRVFISSTKLYDN